MCVVGEDVAAGYDDVDVVVVDVAIDDIDLVTK